MQSKLKHSEQYRRNLGKKTIFGGTNKKTDLQKRNDNNANDATRTTGERFIKILKMCGQN